MFERFTRLVTLRGNHRFLVTLGVMLLLHSVTGHAAQVTLAWDANTEPTLGGYKVYYGSASGSYTSNVDVGNQTTYTVANLQEGATYYFAVKAYDNARTLESGFSNEVNKTFSVTPPPSSSLPSPWLDMDIGNIGRVGSAGYTNGAFTLSGSGTDIWGTEDAFHFVYQPLDGDGVIVARVASMTNTNAWAKAGVMIRESLDANARHAMAVVTPGNGVSFQRRLSVGGSSYHTAGAAVPAPYWVKLVRTGNTFTAYQSADGSSWASIGSTSINMATSVYVGLAVTSHNNSVSNTTVFEHVLTTKAAEVTINCWEDDHQNPVLVTTTNSRVLRSTDGQWTEFSYSRRPFPAVFAAVDEESYGLPVMACYATGLANGQYEVMANLYGNSPMRYFYGYTAADPKAQYVDTPGGVSGTQFQEYSLGTVDISDGNFSIYFQDADLLGGSYPFFGWAWVRLVPR